MAAYPIPTGMKLSLTPIAAIAVGVAVALAFMLMPSDVLEVLMLDSGIPALLPAAAPPLGWTARTACALVAGGGMAAATWLGVYLMLGDGNVTIAPKRPVMPALPKLPGLPKLARLPKLPSLAKLSALLPRARPAAVPTPSDTAVPVLRRADAHPDAPARAPLIATRDLGTPFLDVRAPVAERDLPRDLAAPLSAFDPAAIPDVPAQPVRAVAPLHAVRNPAVAEDGERFEAFELRPPVTPPPSQPPIAAPRTDATIHALLDRLERGVSARTTAPRPGGVDDALTELRRLATR